MSTLPPIPNEPPPNRWYYADVKNQPKGPHSCEELSWLVTAGIVTSETLVTKEGETVWRKYSEISRSTPPPIPDSSKSPYFPSPLSAETPIMEAQGDGGTLQLFAEKVCIRRKSGFVSFFTYGLKGDKDIYLSQISSVQFKAAGLIGGYIQFAFSGGSKGQRGYNEAFTDENTVMFTSQQQWGFEKIKKEIDKRIAERTGENTQPNTASYLGELEKLADFRDKGIITPEEFESKKRQLLGI